MNGDAAAAASCAQLRPAALLHRAKAQRGTPLIAPMRFSLASEPWRTHACAAPLSIDCTKNAREIFLSFWPLRSPSPSVTIPY